MSRNKVVPIVLCLLPHLDLTCFCWYCFPWKCQCFCCAYGPLVFLRDTPLDAWLCEGLCHLCPEASVVVVRVSIVFPEVGSFPSAGVTPEGEWKISCSPLCRLCHLSSSPTSHTTNKQTTTAIKSNIFFFSQNIKTFMHIPARVTYKPVINKSGLSWRPGYTAMLRLTTVSQFGFICKTMQQSFTEDS